VEIYDAEMEGLTRGSEILVSWLDNKIPKENNLTVSIFSDNTSAPQRIMVTSPGLDIQQTRRFRDNILRLLDERPSYRIEIKWVPGHENIKGNDLADSLAKEGTFLPSDYPFDSSAAFMRNSNKRRLKSEWTQRWGADPTQFRRLEYYLCNCTGPQSSPTDRFKTLSRKKFSHLVQLQTGHAFLGQYSQRFIPPKMRPADVEHQSRHESMSLWSALYTTNTKTSSKTRMGFRASWTS
jgi:hypothetical protein